MAGADVKIWAVEKNPNAVVTLRCDLVNVYTEHMIGYEIYHLLTINPR